MRARTAAQDAYIHALKRHALVFGTGPAGTGKTWLAVAHAIWLFERKEVDRIILSRPAVEAGERLGFLPGDMREKVDPYLRPIYDALFDLMDARIVERALQSNEIEIAPLAFMRGRTLSNAVVILDEAQNTTSMQMKMFLTRLGENSRMIVTGDPSQVDLPHGPDLRALRKRCGFSTVWKASATSSSPRRMSFATNSSAASSRPTTRPARANARPRNDGTLPAPALSIDISIESPLWNARLRVDRFCARDRRVGDAGDRAVPNSPSLLTDDAAIRALNRQWRGRDEATNVLSFPAPEQIQGCVQGAPRLLGDIVIAYETTAREAEIERKPFAHHLVHLAVHGFLHLLGYDHESEAEAEEMERLEREILARLDIADPYATRNSEA